MPEPKDIVVSKPPEHGATASPQNNHSPPEICDACGNPRNPVPGPSAIKHRILEINDTLAVLVKKLTEGDQARSKLERLAKFSTLILQIAGLGVVVGFLAIAATDISMDFWNRRVLIDPIAVPKSFEDRGYGSQTVSNHLRDQIERLRDRVEQATAENERQGTGTNGIATRVSGYYLAHPSRRQPIATTATLSALPDLTIPETGLSLHGVVDLVDGLLEIQPRHVSGEITMVEGAREPSQSAASGNHESAKPPAAASPTTLRVTVRLEGRDGMRFLDHPVKDDPDAAIAQGSQDALRLIDPYMAGLGSFYAGDLDVAISEFQEALELKARDGDIKRVLAQAYMGRATNYVDDEKYDLAIDDLNRALEEEPDSAVAYNDRGVAHAGEGKFSDAIDDYTTAIKLDSRLELAYINRGSIYLREGDCRRAIANYKSALEVRPNAPEGLNAAAWLLATCPDPTVRNGKNAIALAQEACRITNGSVAAFQDTLAAAYAEAGRFEQAVQAEDRAIDLAQQAAKPSAATLTEFHARRAQYQAHQAYHLTPDPNLLTNQRAS